MMEQWRHIWNSRPTASPSYTISSMALICQISLAHGSHVIVATYACSLLWIFINNNSNNNNKHFGGIGTAVWNNRSIRDWHLSHLSCKTEIWNWCRDNVSRSFAVIRHTRCFATVSNSTKARWIWYAASHIISLMQLSDISISTEF